MEMPSAGASSNVIFTTEGLTPPTVKLVNKHMEIKLIRTTQLKPIMVPNFVLTEDGDAIPVGELSQEALTLLADEFTKNLLAKAGF
jgi:hypothetical protein